MFSANVLHTLTNPWCIWDDDVTLLCELIGSFWLMFLLFSQMMLFEDFLDGPTGIFCNGQVLLPGV